MTDDADNEHGSRLFVVRIWTEAIASGTEPRGSVRDVATGAHRHFRRWSDLTSFLNDRTVERPTMRGTSP